MHDKYFVAHNLSCKARKERSCMMKRRRINVQTILCHEKNIRRKKLEGTKHICRTNFMHDELPIATQNPAYLIPLIQTHWFLWLIKLTCWCKCSHLARRILRCITFSQEMFRRAFTWRQKRIYSWFFRTLRETESFFHHIKPICKTKPFVPHCSTILCDFHCAKHSNATIFALSHKDLSRK